MSGDGGNDGGADARDGGESDGGESNGGQTGGGERSETTDTPLSVGDTLSTGTRTITEADVVNFAGVSGDFNRLHVDRETDQPFGERIAHGALVFSVTTGLTWQAREGDAAPVFYGVDAMRFVQPVFVGDTLRVDLSVTEVVETDVADADYRITQRAKVKNQDDDVVLTADLLALL